MDYLPKDATIEEACNWLQAKTGQTWVFARLLECHLTPHFWLDYKPGYPTIYGDRIEGYQTRMIFQGDLCRLESDRGDALVNMFTAHDGTLVKVQPGLRVPLSELKFKRESVERVAEIINKTAPTQSAATPAPVVAESADDGEAWKAKARERADEIIKRQRAKDLHPSQEDIADEIAREFRADGVMGAGGKPLTGAYIKRHALKGISSAQNRQLSTSIRRGK
jgi:hypothetical protein